MRLTRLLAAALVAAAASIPAAQAQDCARPKSDVERLVCSNDRVSEAANRMAFAFFLAYRRTPDDALRTRIREEQRDWETQVRDACVDVPCLLQAYEDRTLFLEQN
jgi:uncharacterized protein